MAIPSGELFCDEAVFERTMAGQREVIFNREPLLPMARRLLLLANGETSLRTLLDILHLQGEHVSDAILQLVDAGLIVMCRKAVADEAPVTEAFSGRAKSWAEEGRVTMTESTPARRSLDDQWNG